MSTGPVLKDRRAAAEEFVRRLLTYTTEVTWFGTTSLMRAWSLAVGSLAEGSGLLYVAMLRRTTGLAAIGSYLTDWMADRGTTRLGKSRSKLFVVVAPTTARVLTITSTATDLIEVDAIGDFAVAMNLVIRNGDGSTSETRAIIAITTGTGPNGYDEIEVASLTGDYEPDTDDVKVLARITIPAGELISTLSGPSFQTLAAVTTATANVVLDGESVALGLADKVWCEATVAGSSGDIDPLTVTALTTPVAGIASVYNPEPGSGGTDEETDLDGKYRAIHRPTLANQETLAWLEAMAKEANPDVLRAVRVTSTLGGTMMAKILHRNGGSFSDAQLREIEVYIAARVRSYMAVSLDNVTLTSIEVEAQITMNAGATLPGILKAGSARLAIFLDYRKWRFGGTVDEADLLALVKFTPGVATLVTSTFLPAADTTPDADSLPTLVRLSLQDTVSGETINATLAVQF